MDLDHYQVLGLAREAEHGVVQAAYRHFAREHHPDGGGDEANFRRVAEAWEVLGDPAARAAYDRDLSDRETSSSHEESPEPRESARRNGVVLTMPTVYVPYSIIAGVVVLVGGLVLAGLSSGFGVRQVLLAVALAVVVVVLGELIAR